MIFFPFYFVIVSVLQKSGKTRTGTEQSISVYLSPKFLRSNIYNIYLSFSFFSPHTSFSGTCDISNPFTPTQVDFLKTVTFPYINRTQVSESEN